MALEQRLSLKLSQRLVMTPSLQQAIKLLQMTRLELEGVLSQEMEENPVLESTDETEEEAETPETDEAGEKVEEAPAEAEAEAEDATMDDIDLDAYFNDYLESGENQSVGTYEVRESVPIENTLTREPDLYDHLLWQLHHMEIPPRLREVAELVIGNLDRDGFLVATVEEIQLLGATPEEVEAYHRQVEGLAQDPQLPDPQLLDSEDPDHQPSSSQAASDEDLPPRPEPPSGTPAGIPTGSGGPSANRGRDDRYDPVPGAQPAEIGDTTTAVSVGNSASMESGADSSGAIAQLAAPSLGATSAVTATVLAPDRGLATQTISGPEPDVQSPGPDLTAEVPSVASAEEPVTQEARVPGYSRREVESALELVRGFDPPGVAAVDLRESLLAQLRFRGEEETLTYRLIDEEWPRVLKRQFAAIAKRFGVPLAELEEPALAIGKLETRPGRKFGDSGARYVEPDVVVAKVGDEYAIQLNDDGMPRLRVSKAYRQMLQKLRAEGRQSEAQQFIKEKMRSAMWLIKSLDQRQRTIYKVADSIIKQQQAFLESGIEHLRPMVLRDVADDIGMHESTVSRVVSNKYIHTPRGLYPMKFFFHSGIDRDYGEDISSLTVKGKIQKMIEGENPDKPLSDSELMRRLNTEGIKIARRTVAKYRDELNIPSSTDRKKVF